MDCLVTRIENNFPPTSMDMLKNDMRKEQLNREEETHIKFQFPRESIWSTSNSPKIPPNKLSMTYYSM